MDLKVKVVTNEPLQLEGAVNLERLIIFALQNNNQGKEHPCLYLEGINLSSLQYFTLANGKLKSNSDQNEI